MSRYEKYKDSGIVWFNEVPAHWEIRKIKQCLKSEKNAIKTGPFGSDLKFDDLIEEGIKVYNQRSVLDKDWTSGEGYISEKKYADLETCTIFPDDIVITTRGTIGKAAIFPKGAEQGILHPCLMRIQLNQSRCYIPFIEMIINDASYFFDALKFQSNATTIEVIYSDTLKEIKIALPKYEEQKEIYNYLTGVTQQIDQLITNKKAQAEKLKELRQIEINNAVTKGLNPNAEMKDIGIDWLGKVPKHWEIKRLKNVAHVNQSVINEKTDPDYEIKYIDIGNVTSNGQFLEIQEMTFSEAPSRARRKPKHNSIILSTVRTYLRAIAFIENPDENLIASTGFAVIDAFENLFDASYLYFQMISHIVVERVIANSEGVSYPAISSTKLGDIKIIIPPKTEQEKIASYLKERVSGIDKLIKNVEAQILKLQELRKIKIYEAVTGKIKVNSYAETTA